ncbi:MAG: hypothetical protein GXZ01_02225 [Clostridiaceae bacterium]|nr:hypothetical protein [Clostridiaceae bacterium]
MVKNLKEKFIIPDDEFTPIPFWFWNGPLNEKEIKRQIHDFREKGVMGFVIHPRIGIPEDIEYLSDRFMQLVEFAVAEAARLGMKVVLYDEGMYPSGSAHGLVIKSNPEYASKGLKMTEYPLDNMREVEIPVLDDENIVSVLAVEKKSPGSFVYENTIVLHEEQGRIRFSVPEGKWSLLMFTQCFSRGTIRGIHFGEDDGEPNAPPSADLLNTDAVRKFIEITHERYYSVLKDYFGSTVIAMFTDEPCILGRNHEKGLIPWTDGFLECYISSGNDEKSLPALWWDCGGKTAEIRSRYRKAVDAKLEQSYYSQISEWCEEHGIALTGHPEKSDEIGLLKYFQIPGQDVVWRWVAPEDNKGIEGEHSTMAKCSSDSARHRGRRRNSNECFGCCGPNGIHWAFSVDDMKWYMDWLFVRGVNLLYPHAFFYSVEGERRFGERPPDVGPNNLWWKYYRYISDYIKRMSYIMTDSVNQARVCILCGSSSLPWKAAKVLYRNQMEFNYLEADLLVSDSCSVSGGRIRIREQEYSVAVIEDTGILNDGVKDKLSLFIGEGGKVLVYGGCKQPENELDLEYVEDPGNLAEIIKKYAEFTCSFEPGHPDLRLSHVVKESCHLFVMTNEGEDEINTVLRTKITGRAELWDAWRGSIKEIKPLSAGEGDMRIYVRIPRRESVIVFIDQAGDMMTETVDLKEEKELRTRLDLTWTVSDNGRILAENTDCLVSWAEWPGMANYSGTLKYTAAFQIKDLEDFVYLMDLGEVHELVHLYINGHDMGVKMWKPYVFDITPWVKEGMNTIEAYITNSMANRLAGAGLKSGLIGPVSLIKKYCSR